MNFRTAVSVSPAFEKITVAILFYLAICFVYDVNIVNRYPLVNRLNLNFFFQITLVTVAACRLNPGTCRATCSTLDPCRELR